jgi:small-conductance mechanosensitive channel
LRSLIEGALTAGAALVLTLWLSATIESRLLAGSRANLSVRKIAATVVRAVLLLIGLLIALSAAGIPLAALGVLGGAVGVGIGFGLQKLAANYVSGFASWPNARCASATWSRSTTSRAASPTSTRATP